AAGGAGVHRWGENRYPARGAHRRRIPDAGGELCERAIWNEDSRIQGLERIFIEFSNSRILEFSPSEKSCRLSCSPCAARMIFCPTISRNSMRWWHSHAK